MEKTAENKESIRAADRLVNFIQKNRKVLLAGTIALFAGVAIAGVAIAIVENSRVKAIGQMETYSEQYDALRAKASDAGSEQQLTRLIADLTAFADGHTGYAGAKAYSLLAAIQADRKEWEAAKTAWLAAADLLPESYLAPVSLYNAATVAEELGDTTAALTLYTRCVEEYGETFPLAPRAYFAIGRLQESLNEKAAATAAYRKIVDTWPNDGWTKPAQNRILSLAGTEK